MNEQNSRYYFTGSSDTCYARALYKGNGEYWTGYLEGYATSVRNFQDVDPARYTEAYNKACEIVATVPQGLTAMEKAAYLYRYLCSHTVYQDYDNDYAPGQLYDALVLGRTVCDGFANALSLLYNLAGITCLEKEWYSESGDGHTWDSFCIDGVWYNADPTTDENLDEGSSLAVLIRGFGFSDKYQRFKPWYSDMMPQCTGDTLYVNIKYVSKTDTENVLRTVTQSWLDRNRTVGCVLTDPMNDEEFDNGLRAAIRTFDESGDIKNYYFLKRNYSDFSVLYFINDTK